MHAHTQVRIALDKMLDEGLVEARRQGRKYIYGERGKMTERIDSRKTKKAFVRFRVSHNLSL